MSRYLFFMFGCKVRHAPLPTPAPRARTHDGSFDLLEALCYVVHVHGNQTSPETPGMHCAQEEHCAQEAEGSPLCLHVLQEGWESAARPECRGRERPLVSSPLDVTGQARQPPREQTHRPGLWSPEACVSSPGLLTQLSEPSSYPDAPPATLGSTIQ